MNTLYPIVRRVRRPLLMADAEPPLVLAGPVAPSGAVAVDPPAPAAPPLVRVEDALKSAAKLKGKAGAKIPTK